MLLITGCLLSPPLASPRLASLTPQAAVPPNLRLLQRGTEREREREMEREEKKRKEKKRKNPVTILFELSLCSLLPSEFILKLQQLYRC